MEAKKQDMTNFKPKPYRKESTDRWPDKCTLDQLKEGMIIRGMNPKDCGFYRMHIIKIFKENPDDADEDTLIVYKYYGRRRHKWFYAVAEWWLLAMYMEWD